MEVSNFITIILFIISCVSIVISVVSFIRNGNKDIKQDTSKDSYKWGQLDEKLNGSRYEITLNDSVENYSIIKIFYSNKTDYSSTEMYDANNKEICLMLSFSIEGLNIARTIYRNIKITKKQLKTTTQGYLSMITTGGVDSNISAAANDIYIHKIIGYN